MNDIKINSILAIIVFLLIGCEESTKVEDSSSSARQNTNNDSDLGYETANIQDYFYDFDEKINAQYLYYNQYFTRGSNTFANLNPYIDTLNFSTFPSYTVEIENQLDTIGYQLALTTENIDQYATLYPLNELDAYENKWCNNILVQYQGDCPTSIDVDFDYSLSLSSVTGKEIDTDISPAVFQDIVSKKSTDFNFAWTNVDTIKWDGINERYDLITPDSSETMSVTICAGICDSTKLNSTLPPCDVSFGSANDTNCYDSTYVIQNEIENVDYFDSLIYIGVIDTNRYSIEGLMFIDRTEWDRHDIEYKSTDKSITLDTTFVYYQVRVPDDSPMYHQNGDCNQNLIWDQAEKYYEYGLDWCPDSLENGVGRCKVIDEDGDGELFDEEPCNCLGDWREFLDADENEPNPNYDGPVEENSDWEENNSLDPNGDNWNDCGLDGICPGNPNDTNGNENGTEQNNKWDRGEGYEKNNQYDYDDLFGGVVKPSEYYIDKKNGVMDLAEYCYDVKRDGECNGQDPFEDRNCNDKWDAAETVDVGNGIWDNDEVYIDTNENGQWDPNENGQWNPGDPGEPLYVFSDRLATFIVDYKSPSNPEAVLTLDTLTSVTLYYGNPDNQKYVTANNFLKSQQITVERSKGFYDIDSLVTIYTNKIIDHPLTGISGDYYLTKTKWFQDLENTAFDEDDLSKPYYGGDYGYDYHLFQIGGNREIYKILHPAYYKYYGYYTKFEDLDLGFWRTEMAEKEIYIHTYNGLLRSGEYIYSDTTIVTPVADYYIEKFYEVEHDTISIKMKKITYLDQGLGTYTCIEPPRKTSWIEDYNISPPFNCPPVDTTLNNTYKITNTKLITMIGSGLEFGFRNTIWLGSAGTGDPLGIVKDQLEIRWSEPFWEEYGSSWDIISRLELRSLRKNNNGTSRMLNIFDFNNKQLSLKQIGNEFDNDAYKYSPVFGLHRLWIPDEK